MKYKESDTPIEPMMSSEQYKSPRFKTESLESDVYISAPHSVVMVKQDDTLLEGGVETSSNVSLSIKAEPTDTVVMELHSGVIKYNDMKESKRTRDAEADSRSGKTRSSSCEDQPISNKTDCLICGKTFQNIMEYSHHLNIHLKNQDPSGDIKTESTECDRHGGIFPNKGDFAVHKINCSELYRCHKCDKKCSSESSLKIHMKYTCKSKMSDLQKGIGLFCTFCYKSFNKTEHLTAHVYAVHKSMKSITEKAKKSKSFSCT